MMISSENVALVPPHHKKKQSNKRETSGDSVNTKRSAVVQPYPWVEEKFVRPHEDEQMQNHLETSIEKKRQRITMEAKIREEKAKFKQNIMSGVGLSSGGGSMSNKLRGATEADFFQKNNTEQKGWTFSYDGTI